MDEEKKEGGIENKVKEPGLNFRKILEGRAKAEGANPSTEHVDLMLGIYYAANGKGTLNEEAIRRIVKLYVTSPIMQPTYSAD